MFLDRFRKKTKRPPSGGNSSLETIDISKEVPQIDDVLAKVDKAINDAKQIEEELRPRPRDRCSC